MSEQPRDVDHTTEEDEHSFTEHIEIASSELVEKTKELIEEGSVRRLKIRNQDDEVLLEVPLTAGVVVGGHSCCTGVGRFGGIGGPANPREDRGGPREERRNRW
jgi:hypothetical protein